MIVRLIAALVIVGIVSDEHQLHIDLHVPQVPHPSKAGPVRVMRPAFAPRTYAEESAL